MQKYEQSANAYEMVVVVLRVELRAIDEPHAALQALVERACPLEILRRRCERLDEVAPPLGELADDLRQRSRPVPLCRGLEAARVGRLWPRRAVEIQSRIRRGFSVSHGHRFTSLIIARRFSSGSRKKAIHRS